MLVLFHFSAIKMIEILWFTTDNVLESDTTASQLSHYCADASAKPALLLQISLLHFCTVTGSGDVSIHRLSLLFLSMQGQLELISSDIRPKAGYWASRQFIAITRKLPCTLLSKHNLEWSIHLILHVFGRKPERTHRHGEHANSTQNWPSCCGMTVLTLHHRAAPGDTDVNVVYSCRVLLCEVFLLQCLLSANISCMFMVVMWPRLMKYCNVCTLRLNYYGWDRIILSLNVWEVFTCQVLNKALVCLWTICGTDAIIWDVISYLQRHRTVV